MSSCIMPETMKDAIEPVSLDRMLVWWWVLAAVLVCPMCAEPFAAPLREVLWPFKALPFCAWLCPFSPPASSPFSCCFWNPSADFFPPSAFNLFPSIHSITGSYTHSRRHALTTTFHRRAQNDPSEVDK
eukprot:TRINITY_DN26184_c0_g1_i1.p3 TRINITY_DN26184_c0_g1~~TRINITY_DN26184_c0_g1_i1.p3  ORF type:complete len:129 (-),score=4.76 TRINITY_DN26184_c0_g1_i1:943-1329(-)